MDPIPNPADPEVARLLKPLEMFRARTSRAKIHPQEKFLVAVLSAQMLFMPWALGGVHVASHVVSLGLALLTFIVSLMPRDYGPEHTENGESFRLLMWPKLVRFPLFWLGLALLVYIMIQALNPAWVYRDDPVKWWMEKASYISWLPSGVQAPLEMGGEWRRLLVYAAIFLTISSLWVGITRRRSLQFLLTVVAVNGFVLAGYGVIQRFMGNGKIFWFYDSPNDYFFSSFIYKNHAGAYLNLTLIVACGLAAWHYLRAARRLDKSNPSGVFLFVATGIAISILLSQSRGAAAIMLGFLMLAMLGFIVEQFRSPQALRRNVILLTLVLFFGYFLKTGFGALRITHDWTRLSSTMTANDPSMELRGLATKASIDMLKDTWPRGTGAGSFLFLFVPYQKHYPDLWLTEGKRAVWSFAHNDIVQFPIELGLVGMLIIVAGVGWVGLRLIRSFFWQNALSSSIVVGLVCMLVHAWFDFIFNCPAVLLTAWVMLVSAVQWAVMEETGQRG